MWQGANRVDLTRVPKQYKGRISIRRAKANYREQQWSSVPRWLTNLTDLITLDLSGNRITYLTDSIGNLADLTSLYLSGNQITQLPGGFSKLTDLSELSLSHNRLTELPDSIGNLTHLTSLDLSGNQLTELPDSIGNLTHLTSLDLSGNQLTRLPGGFGNLAVLSELSLSHNRLTELPDSIGNLTHLTSLDLSGNQLTELPDSIGNLTYLSFLHLGQNQLIELPYQLSALLLSDGFQLKVDGNPLREPLPELVKRGSADLAAYLRSLEDALAQYEGKVLVVGEGNVGKTSLVAALKGDTFVEGRPTTHGIEISSIQFRHPDSDRNLNMILRAWDFGGQEVYRVSHQFFFSRRTLYLVVWHSRQGQERDEVEGTLRRIKLRVGDEAIAIIVATHCRERLADLDYPHLDRLFPGMLAGAFETDSSTGDGIAHLRDAISQQASKLPQMGQRISPRWTAAREAVLALADTEPQIRYERFAAICKQHRVTEDEIDTLAKLMHDLGLIIYYDADEGLKDIVVLNPEWLTRAISYVLEDRATVHAGGILDHTRLKEIWQDRDDGYAPQYHPYFLRLMEKYDISYRLDGDETHSLVPQMVQHRQPALRWQHGSGLPAGVRSLSLICELSEPAPGLIPWMTVRHSRASTGKYWRRGVFLRHPIDEYHSEALLELLRENELALEVRASSPDFYFNVLRDSIEDLITRRWPGLTYRLFVPCPGTAADGKPCRGRFPLDGLVRVREKGQTGTYPCGDCGQLYEISLLLTGFAIPSEPLTRAIGQIHARLAELATDVSGLRGQAAETAGVVRRIHRVMSVEVTDCPTLFTIGKKGPSLGKRAQFYKDHYKLTLWCQHPGHEHAWGAATYEVDLTKELFARIAPYARLVFRILQLVVPVAAAIDVASLPSAQQASAQVRLDVMQAIVDELPADSANDLEWADRDFAGLNSGPEKLSPAQGKALRAVRQIILEKDPLRAFGDMRPVQAPSGDFLWVCPTHYPEYDPGLPALP
jgi:internalin A